MIAATQRWWKRNRTNILVGAGVIGAGYLAGQYVLSRFAESRQRSKDEKASKENLEIRFRSNQQDCTYTVLALLPTIRDEIISALPVEEITEQLQHERQERLKRLAASEAASSEYPSAPPSVVDDASTASFIHASQTSSDGSSLLRPKRSKAQLWQDMKINCEFGGDHPRYMLIDNSDCQSSGASIHTGTPQHSDQNSAQSTWSEDLSLISRRPCITNGQLYHITRR